MAERTRRTTWPASSRTRRPTGAWPIGWANSAREAGGNVVFYLATAPRFFGGIVERLAAAGLVREPAGGHRRVVIEKPFGHDLASAVALNQQLLGVLDERQIYRMDHFLGKETVQNIMALRFGNGIFEPLWNRAHIDHVQITAAETVGVEGRGSFYDATGALRDMVPNHLFQLLAMTAMETPNSFDADAVRTEKAKVIEAIHHLTPEQARSNSVRGQYGAGTVAGQQVEGLPRRTQRGAATAGPKPTSRCRLSVDNWRWAGVPFYLRTGKAMQARRTEIVIQFKQVPCALFRDGPRPAALRRTTWSCTSSRTRACRLRFEAKVPGPSVRLAGVDMDFRYADYFNAAPSTGYETLLYDCLIGDATLFQRADNIEAGWRAVQPFLDAWRQVARRCCTATRPAAGARGRPMSCWRRTAAAGGTSRDADPAMPRAGRPRPRLLLSDVDGTLVTDRQGPHRGDAARRGRLSTAGIRFAITSSRPPAGLRHRGRSAGHRHADRGLQRRHDRGTGDERDGAGRVPPAGRDRPSHRGHAGGARYRCLGVHGRALAGSPARRPICRP